MPLVRVDSRVRRQDGPFRTLQDLRVASSARAQHACDACRLVASGRPFEDRLKHVLVRGAGRIADVNET